MKPTKNAPLLVTLLVVLIICEVLYIASVVSERTTELLSSVFFHNSIETKDIIKKYDVGRDQVRVMIVPGHDDEFSGAMFGSIKEADLNLMVAKELQQLLLQDNGIEVFLTRDESGYNPKLQRYLEQEADNIENFRISKKGIMDGLISDGKVTSYVNVWHNFARPEVAGILYGLNKYANDNKFDIVIHIHFNDYPGRTGSYGKYSGFSIYVPEKQYSNAEASRDFAEKLKAQLELSFASSDLPKESSITEDQELISIGSYNTVDPVAVLIEYGYIYESQFTKPDIMKVILDELAYQTYVAIMNYINDVDVVTRKTFSQAFDQYQWTSNLSKGDKGLSVLAMQYFLRDRGYYPYRDNMNNCPLNGNFGDCTEVSLMRYQLDNDIEASGYFGPQTRAIFNTAEL